MDMQEILSQVITSTNEIFEAEAGSVALLDASGDRIVIRAAVGAGSDAVRGLSLPVDKGVIGWVASNAQPALIPDVTQDRRFYKEIDKESGFHTKSILCVPMKADGHIIGVIELMNMRPDYLSDNGLKILSVIADHAALAIENARLLAQTRQQAEEQALLFESMAIVTSDLALDTVLDAVSRQMVEALKCDLCIISRWNRQAQTLQPIQSYTSQGGRRPQQPRRLSPPDFPHDILTTQRSTVLESASANQSAQATTWLKQLGVKSLFLIPLIYRRRTIGLAEIGRTYARQPITPSELRLAETMATQAAVAIEHASLYNAATRRLAEAKLLQEVMVAAASTLDFDQVLQGTITAVHRTLGIERLGFFLPAHHSKEMVAHPTSIGFPSGSSRRIPMENSVVGWVQRTGQPLLLPDVSKAKNYFELITDTQAELCVPVMLNNQVAAVLNVESPHQGAFTDDDLRLFEAIAAELAVALENTRLFSEIRAAEEKYRDLFDNANDFIFTLDNNFRISSANKAVLESTGYRLEELVGTHVIHFIPPAQHHKIYTILKNQLLANEPSPTFEIAVVSRDKQERLLEVTIRVQRQDKRPAGLHCIARDITQRRELERQLRQIEKLSTIGKLVAGVAHELNNPLTSIIGYASLLQQNDLPHVVQEDLQIIFRQAERARVIVRDLLTFARNISLETEPVDLNEVLQASLRAMKPMMQAHNIKVVTTFDFGLPLIIADPHQLEQVFVNLLTNAIQMLATVQSPRRITLETRQHKETIKIKLTDNGPGIPTDIINRIFDPFFSTKQVGEGTGLGLSICFGIISEHQGRIWAESQKGQGATFFIELPVTVSEIPHLETVHKPVSDSSATPADNNVLEILAVDDEAYLLKLLRRVLERQGHQVVVADNGQAALSKLQTTSYDLVICDILMPDMLGPELYHTVIRQKPFLVDRFIFITGNVIDPDTREFLETSNLVWLAKPFLPADIERAVAQTTQQVKQQTAASVQK